MRIKTQKGTHHLSAERGEEEIFFNIIDRGWRDSGQGNEGPGGWVKIVDANGAQKSHQPSAGVSIGDSTKKKKPADRTQGSESAKTPILPPPRYVGNATGL